MAADVSAITYFAPIAAFFVVFLVVFAVLFKSRMLGESKWLGLFVSFVIAALFVSAAGVRRYVEVITPWFGALLVSLFFILVLLGLIGVKHEGLSKGLGIIFLIVAILVFLISGIVVFSDTLAPWLPGSPESYGNPVSDVIYSPPVIGAVVLIILAALVSIVLVKAK
ncbi:MAG TPA: hypothetical protein VJK03_01595 [Candidatus Nanoarchaeia archaeon]|nr:hypothetical protein [Candidatus Nanoarchaeia archaeon]